MVLTAIDPNDPQPQRSDPRYKDNYAAFRKADRAWNARESTRRKKVAAADNAASSARDEAAAAVAAEAARLMPPPPPPRQTVGTMPPSQPLITSDDVRAARETAQAAAARAACSAQAAQTTEDWASAAFLMREAATAAAAAGKVAQAQPQGIQLWMECDIEDSSAELHIGEGEWDQVGYQHWVSQVHKGVRGDKRMHLWKASTGCWYVTSSEAWASNREYPAFGTNGEYPHVQSDFRGMSPWAGTFQGGHVRFSVVDCESDSA